ncbi:MAG: DUF4214 domain-containing protein [Paracoccaceae bacterium]
MTVSFFFLTGVFATGTVTVEDVDSDGDFEFVFDEPAPLPPSGGAIVFVGSGSAPEPPPPPEPTEAGDMLSGTGAADVLNGLGGDDILEGLDGDDSLSGDAGDDSLAGGPGNDVLAGGTGDDAVSGGEGTDLALFTAGFADAAISEPSTGLFDVASEADGTDRLDGVERADFSDGTFLFDLPEGDTGFLVRLYEAAFDRMPVQGLLFWSDVLVEGATRQEVANAFATSPEFIARFGDSDEAFVDTLYLNVLGRPADEMGAEFWLGALEDGASRGDVLRSFSESPEFRAETEAQIGTGIFVPDDAIL